MSYFDEEALIDAVLRVRMTQPNLTAAETHVILSAEPEFAEVPFPAVKKAAGKATRREAKKVTATAVAHREEMLTFRHIAAIIHRSPPVAPPKWIGVWSFATGCNLPPLPPCTGALRDVLCSLREKATAVCTYLEMVPPSQKQIPVSEALTSAAFPYILALRAAYTVGENAVTVTSSSIHGNGVFATRDLKVNEMVTTYPVDALRIHADEVCSVDLDAAGARDSASFLFLYRDESLKKSHEARKWDDYKMISVHHGDSIAFYGDPSRHSANACGHMINDPTGTDLKANCAECPLLGGVVTAICIVRPVRKGEELLLQYGGSYWSDRD